MVEIVIPISRPDHLMPLFSALDALGCDAEKTALLTYVDGDKALYDAVATLTDNSKFTVKRCIQRKADKVPFGIPDRRVRIAQIHNELKPLVGDCQYVFGLEDDTIPPSSALRLLLADYGIAPHAGFISGVEPGRWGVPYIGAWRADDVYEPTKLETLPRGLGIEEIDAGGFYCFLTKREHYVNHHFKPWNGNVLGPDVDYGLALRREGYKNYADFTVCCKHLQADGKALTMGGPLARVQVNKVMRGKRELWLQKIERL